MPVPWTIERLDSQHDRSAFSCGKPSLDEFLKLHVNRFVKKDYARAYVAVERPSPAILGYYTLSNCHIEAETLPEEDRRGRPSVRVPAALIGRLAVTLTHQGKSLGRLLLMDALARCRKTADEIALSVVVVDALDAEAEAFYLRQGFSALTDAPLHLYITMKTIRRAGL